MKHSNYLLFLIITLFFSCTTETIQLKEIGIIPKPLFQEINKGVFVLDENIRFISDTELNEVSDYLKLYIEENYQVSFTPQKESKKIVFTSNDSISNEEGYELKIEENNNQLQKLELSTKTTFELFLTVKRIQRGKKS